MDGKGKGIAHILIMIRGGWELLLCHFGNYSPSEFRENRCISKDSIIEVVVIKKNCLIKFWRGRHQSMQLDFYFLVKKHIHVEDTETTVRHNAIKSYKICRLWASVALRLDPSPNLTEIFFVFTFLLLNSSFFVRMLYDSY